MRLKMSAKWRPSCPGKDEVKGPVRIRGQLLTINGIYVLIGKSSSRTVTQANENSHLVHKCRQQTRSPGSRSIGIHRFRFHTLVDSCPDSWRIHQHLKQRDNHSDNVPHYKSIAMVASKALYETCFKISAAGITCIWLKMTMLKYMVFYKDCLTWTIIQKTCLKLHNSTGPMVTSKLYVRDVLTKVNHKMSICIPLQAGPSCEYPVLQEHVYPPAVLAQI